MDIEYGIAESIEDLIDLLMLRVEIFVVEQEGPHEEEPDEYDRKATFVVAKTDGKIVGTARFRVIDEKVKIERIAVKKEFRRKGIGKGLVHFILNHIQDEHPRAVFLHAQTIAQDFYTKLGFQPVGKTFMEAGIEHIEMVREV